MDNYESFTRDKISRLRLEIDVLERSLKEYLSIQARAAGVARRSGGDNPRSGAFGVILDAIAKAGVNGLTLDEMIDAAAAEAFEVKRNTLRSQIWQAKNEGIVEQIAAGRYRSAGAEKLTSGRIEFPNEDEIPGLSSPPPPETERDYGTTKVVSNHRPASAGAHRPARWSLSEMADRTSKDDLDDDIPF